VSSTSTVAPGRVPTWREGALEALPLLLLSVGAFLLAFFLSRTGVEFGATQAPLWSLLAALGAVTTGGGIAVVAANRAPEEDTRTPPPTRTESIPGSPRYSTPPSALAPPGTAAPSGPLSPVVRSARSTGRPPTDPSATEPSAVTGRVGSPRTPPARFGSEMERALVEMQATLADLAAERKPPGGLPSGPVPPSSAPAPRIATTSTSSESITGRAAADVLPHPANQPPPWSEPPAAPRTVPGTPCASCGQSIEDESESRPCIECGRRLCWLCELKSLEEGRYLLCDKCAILAGSTPKRR
jgi:hypothetical protein